MYFYAQNPCDSNNNVKGSLFEEIRGKNQPGTSEDISGVEILLCLHSHQQ